MAPNPAALKKVEQAYPTGSCCNLLEVQERPGHVRRPRNPGSTSRLCECWSCVRSARAGSKRIACGCHTFFSVSRCQPKKIAAYHFPWAGGASLGRRGELGGLAWRFCKGWALRSCQYFAFALKACSSSRALLPSHSTTSYSTANCSPAPPTFLCSDSHAYSLIFRLALLAYAR